MRYFSRMTKALIAIALLLTLTACTPAQISLWADHLGTPITMAEAEQRAEAWANRDCLPSHSASTAVECAITDAHHQFDVERVMSLDRFVALGVCESGLNPAAQNRYSTAGGLYQFLDSTAESVFPKVGYDVGDKYDPKANADAAAWLMTNVGPSQWQCKV